MSHWSLRNIAVLDKFTTIEKLWNTLVLSLAEVHSAEVDTDYSLFPSQHCYLSCSVTLTSLINGCKWQMLINSVCHSQQVKKTSKQKINTTESDTACRIIKLLKHSLFLVLIMDVCKSLLPHEIIQHLFCLITFSLILVMSVFPDKQCSLDLKLAH